MSDELRILKQEYTPEQTATVQAGIASGDAAWIAALVAVLREQNTFGAIGGPNDGQVVVVPPGTTTIPGEGGAYVKRTTAGPAIMLSGFVWMSTGQTELWLDPAIAAEEFQRGLDEDRLLKIQRWVHFANWKRQED